MKRTLGGSNSFLSVKSVNAPSCNDLGACDCEGWLWLKDNDYVVRWCVLRNSVLHIFNNSKVKESEVDIQILNSTIRPVEKTNSKNQYIKILNEDKDKTFMFGTPSKSDFQKWLNKLSLSAAGIELNEKDPPVGGFTSGYIVSPAKTMVLNKSISQNGNRLDGDVQSRKSVVSSLNSYSVSEKSQTEIDERVQICYDRSISEYLLKSNPDSKVTRPITPPRKNRLKVKESVKSSSVSFNNKDDKNNSIDKNDFSSDNTNKSPIRQISCLDEKIVMIRNEPSEVVNVNDQFVAYDETDSAPVNFESKMNMYKKISELERLIRDKRRMLAKIDQVLKSAHLKDKIIDFWDDHSAEILTIVRSCQNSNGT